MNFFDITITEYERRARTNNLGDIIIIAANIIVIIRNVLGTKNLGDILSERESIAHELHELLFEATEPWGVQVERVEVMSFVDSMHVDDSDGDDIIAHHNGVDCDVIMGQLNLIYLRKSLSTHMQLDQPGERREGSRAVDEGHGSRGRGS